jgi:hypothetical protein
MIACVSAKDRTLSQLEAQFDLTQADDPSFFLEWQTELPTL